MITENYILVEDDDFIPPDFKRGKLFAGPPKTDLTEEETGTQITTISDCLNPETSISQLRGMATDISRYPREELLNKFSFAFFEGRRTSAYALSLGLIRSGIPPAFWVSPQTNKAYTPEQRLDLLCYDIEYIAYQYREHAKGVKYERYRRLLDTSRTDFFNTARYVFNNGQRPLWKIVASFGLPKDVQFECRVLKSTAVNNIELATNEMRDRIFKVLAEDLQNTRKTKAYTDDDARVSLLRRHKLYLCRRMCGRRSNVIIATLYWQMTGERITPDIAARQLRIVDEILHKNKTASAITN